MNKALKLIAGAAVAVLSSAAFAQASATFAVSGSVTAKCESNTAGGQSVGFPAYDAFAASPLSSTTSATISFRCTRGLNLTGVSFSYTTGSVAGLAYTLNAGTAADTVEGTGLSAYRQYVYTVTGTIAAGQAGEVGASGSDTATMTITY